MGIRCLWTRGASVLLRKQIMKSPSTSISPWKTRIEISNMRNRKTKSSEAILNFGRKDIAFGLQLSHEHWVNDFKMILWIFAPHPRFSLSPTCQAGLFSGSQSLAQTAQAAPDDPKSQCTKGQHCGRPKAGDEMGPWSAKCRVTEWLKALWVGNS